MAPSRATKCRHCYIGRLQAASLPFVTPLDGHIMVVPNAHARQCDTCRAVIFNEDFLDRLHYFLDRLAQADLDLENTDWYALSDQQENWQSSGRNS